MKTATAIALSAALLGLAATASAAKPSCVYGFRAVKTRVFHKSPKRRLITRVSPRNSHGAYTCIRTHTPDRKLGGNYCRTGYKFERASIVHPGPRFRTLRGKWLRLGGEQRTCIAFSSPKHLFWNPKDSKRPAPPKMRPVSYGKLTGTVRNRGGVVVSSRGACERACRVGDVCKAYTYDQKKKKCYLLTDVRGADKHMGFLSGVRTEGGDAWKVVKSSRTGAVLVTLPTVDFSTRKLYSPMSAKLSGVIAGLQKVKESKHCANMCTLTTGCRAYQYNKTSKRCILWRNADTNSRGARVPASVRAWPRTGTPKYRGAKVKAPPSRRQPVKPGPAAPPGIRPKRGF